MQLWSEQENKYLNNGLIIEKKLWQVNVGKQHGYFDENEYVANVIAVN